MAKAQDVDEISAESLVTPIYIDTSALLDLLASLEDGFTFVEKVTTQSAQSREMSTSVKAQAGTEFGIPNVLSLLKINLGGSLDSKRGEDDTQHRQADRYHTYGSLLFRLRDGLMRRELVKQFDGTSASWDSIQVMDFVELRGSLRPNPYTESLKSIDRMAVIMETFAGVQSKLIATQPQGQGKSRQIANQTTTLEQKAQLEQVKAVRSILSRLIEDVEKTDIRLVVADLKPSKDHRAVATLFTQYLRDPSLTELARKEYRIFGRVVGKVSGPDESINLLEGTGLGGLGDQAVDEMAGVLQMGSLPRPETKIAAPGVQILPIAIYV